MTTCRYCDQEIRLTPASAWVDDQARTRCPGHFAYLSPGLAAWERGHSPALPPNTGALTVTEIIDTPAEGFPLPTMDPPSRARWDVGRLLSRGSKARAVQRAAATPGYEHRADGSIRTDVAGMPVLAVEMRTPEEWQARRNGEPVPPASERMVRVADLFDREIGAGRAPAWGPADVVAPSVFDAEIERRLHPALQVDPDGNVTPVLERHPSGAALWREIAVDPSGVEVPSRESIHVSSFDAGRAYERGAALRRNVGAKSLGSRRVQAQGVAADYLRDDPERGALHAAMVLAGFLGHDPATVTP